MEYGWNNALSSGLYLAGVREFEFGVALGINGHYFSVGSLWLRLFKIALRNIHRLCLLSDKSCIFAFQAWKSYLIIIFMITLGMVLRNSPILRHFLAVIYAAIGGALFVSSFHFLPVYLAGKNPEAALLAI